MDEGIDNRNDKGYKYLLRAERLFVELLKSFVDQGWAQKITVDDVNVADKAYILTDFNDKEADLVFKINMDGKEVYFCLLELQSTVDFQMPYRLLCYMVEIWRTVLKDTDSKEVAKKGFKLPPIVPCVLYNGKYNWTAARSFREKLAEHEKFGEYVLDFKYILIDVRRYKDDDLLNLANVIGSVFFVDKSEDYGKDFVERFKTITNNLKSLKEDDVNLFKIWLKNIGTIGLTEDQKNMIMDILQGERKVNDMVYAFERVLKHERLDGKKEGKAEGKVEGISEGKAEGIAEGISKGKEEGIREKSIKVAQKMINKGFSLEDIADTTELPIETIKELAKK